MFPGMGPISGGAGGINPSSSANSGIDGGNLSSGKSSFGGSTLNMGGGNNQLYTLAIVGAVGIAALWLLRR